MVGPRIPRDDLARQVPNFTAHAADKYRTPATIRTTCTAMPWQSGITGIAYNPKLTKREITSFKDLLDPAFKGQHRHVHRDAGHHELWPCLGIGVKPLDATIDDVKNAQKKLLSRPRWSSAGYYDNDVLRRAGRGDLAITMAWSGDIFQLAVATTRT